MGRGEIKLIEVSWQTFISLAALITAITTVLTRYNRLYDFVKRQEEQDKLIKSIQEEQTLLTYGVLACLKGLNKLGCDGEVSGQITAIETHINRKAHSHS